MKVLKFLTNRITVISVALIAQLVVIAYAAGMFNSPDPNVKLAMHILSLIVVCFVINENVNVSIKLTWVVFIMITPIFGSVLYLLTGGKAPRKRVRRLLCKTEEKNKFYRPENKNAKEELKKYNSGLYMQSRYLENMGFGLLGNTEAKYYPSGEAAFPDMLSEIEKAEKFIFAEYFIFDKGEMLDKFIQALAKKAQEGVEVRLIYDDFGCLFTLPYKFNEELEKKGIKCIVFNRFVPILSAIMNNRDHRKILVIDSCVAFTGGINIADEYINKKQKYGYWKDNAVCIKGQGAAMFSVLFLDLWCAFKDKNEDIGKFVSVKSEYTAGYVQPFSDMPMDDEVLGANVYINAINNAKNYIYIFTPYLIPNEEMLSALCLAAKKGVDVRIIIPGIPDKKSVYLITRAYCNPLLQAGVKIYKMTSGFVHSKGFVSDDEVACVGTINLDFRSLHHHFECGCMFYLSPVVHDIKKDMWETMEKCAPVKGKGRMHGVISNAYYALLRLVAPLM